MAAENPEVREALEELDQYLSDILPPLVVADSVKLLLRYPPDLAASAIHSWTASQFRGGAEITMSDYLYYAVRKVHLMGEFRLVPSQPFENFLETVKRHLVAYCPAEERAKFEENL